MEGFKEFQGKDLDSAIEEACGYFNTAREKLEIEIVQDSKSGIFGIVGARKAKVRARRVQLREAVENILGRKGGAAGPSADAPADIPAEAAGEPVAGAEGKGKAPRQREDSRSPAPRQEKRHDRSRGRKGAQDDGAPGADAAAEPAAARSESPRDAERPATGGRKSDKKNDKNGGRGNEKSAARNDDKGARQNGAVRSADENGACQTEKNAETSAGAGKNGERSDRASGRSQNGHAENGRRGEGRGRKNDARDSREGREGRSAARDGARDAARQARPGAADMLDDDFEEAAEGLPVTPLEQLDQEQLMALVHETVRNLVRPIVGEAVQLEVAVVGGRVQVGIESEEDSGLLIGREGQTLAALQYMISRIVSRGMNAAVRVQLDAGEYRRRQDERLREMALALADKVRQSGRSYSTRPLSSYHRRIVHVCLQDATDVQTRSTGDGPLKRVVILRRKTEKS